MDESGQTRESGSSDVNDSVRQNAGDDFTARDFRTWAGTVLPAQEAAVLAILQQQLKPRPRVRSRGDG